MARTSIEDLFVRFRDCGDTVALAAVFDATAPELARIASFLCAGSGSAEDVLQETFLTAIERRASYDEGQALLPWLLGILANLARRRIRSEARGAHASSEVLDLLAADASENPLDIAAGRELDAHLREAISGLPEPYRAVLSAHVMHGLSAKDIAELRSGPASTVRSQIQRGLDMLRRALPAGVAGSVAVATVRAADLAVMRGEVIAAAEAVGSLSKGVTLGGLLMVSKKLSVVAILVLFLSATLAVVLWPEGSLGSGKSEQSSTSLSEDMDGVSLGDGQAGTSRKLLAPIADEEAAILGGSVDVRVVWRGEDAPIEGLSVAIALDPRGEWTITQGRSDADGRVQFTNLAAGRYFAKASLDAVRPVTVRVGQASEVILKVMGYGQISGQVVDLLDRPIAGATLWMSGANVLIAPKQVGVSDDEGRYSFRSPAVNAALYAEKAGRGRSGEHGVLSFASEEMQVDLRLGEGALPLRGVVLDERGRPVEGAEVTSQIWGPAPPGPYTIPGFSIPRSPTLTGSDGQYVIANVLPGRVTCWAQAEGFMRSQIKVDHPGGEARFVLKHGGVLAGTVRDASGKPVALATISTSALSDSEHLSVRSAEDGRYSLQAIPLGEQEFAVTHLKHGSASTTIELDAHVKQTWDPVLDPSKILSGRIIDERGEPIPGWFLRVTASRVPAISAYTDEQGEFSIPVSSDREHRIMVQDGNYLNAAIRTSRRGVRTSDSPIELVVSDSSPADAFLVGRYVRPHGFEDSLFRLIVYDPKGAGSASFGVGPDGYVRIGPLLPGSYLLSPHSFRTALGGEDAGPFELHAGEEYDFGTIEVPTPTAFQLSLELGGGPAPGMLMVNYQFEDESALGKLWNNGFVDEAWKPGKYHLEIAAGQRHLATAADVEVLTGQRNEAHIELIPGRPCEFVSLAPVSSKPPQGSKVEITDGHGEITTYRLSYGTGYWALPVGNFRARFVPKDPSSGKGPEVKLTISSLNGPRLRIELPAR